MGLTHSSSTWTHSPIIELSNGRKLRGKQFKFSETKLINTEDTDTSDLSIHTTNAFLNIPFAKPSIEENRFKRPVPADPWPIDQILDCTKMGPRCPHGDMWTEIFEGLFNTKNEDCLRLNVFTPFLSIKQLNNLPVMVYIHGGGFVVHSAAHYGDFGICKNLCTKNVVIVTIQYRLGFFGFLCLDDKIVPGNMGLWDQALALRWIHNNIAAFGGDPNNVTVFGQSAGAASTDFLALSPHSRDLFQKMIVMSGSASCTFALNTKEHVRNSCVEFAVENGFVIEEKMTTKEQNHVLLKFFQKMPSSALELSLVGKVGYKINRQGMLDLTPVIDGDFLPKPIDELRKEAPRKSIITGITEFESLLFTVSPRKNSLRDEMRKVILREFIYRGISPSESDYSLLKRIYFDEEKYTDHKNSAKACVKVTSDVLIVNGVWEFADSMTQYGHTVYLYSFEHFHSHSFGIAGLLFPFKGSTHCTELPYLFLKGIIGNFHHSTEELEVAHRFSTLFTNFAKYGDPNGPTDEGRIAKTKWTPLKVNDTHKFLRFTSSCETTQMDDNFCDRRPEMWRKIFQKPKELVTEKLEIKIENLAEIKKNF